jgi:hypothetical protein
MDSIKVSTLNKTWIIDLDGTVLKHAGYMKDGYDSLLPEAKNFLNKLSKNDFIIFITARKEKYRKITEEFLSLNNIIYSLIIFDAPLGERIVINDIKPTGLKTAIALNVERDSGLKYNIIECL